jgi:hypothetical protein
MSLTVLTPLAALLVLLAIVPLAALRAGEARARSVARALGLPETGVGRSPAVAVAVAAVLLGLAAAQPVLAFDAGKRVRADAEVYVVLDTTLSMMAAESPGAVPRFERARETALRLRAELDDVRVGIASFTDRVLPHLFPSSDAELYAATLERAVRIEHPPPERQWEARATTFGSLDALATRNFYAPSSGARAFVLLTDGETREYSLPALAAILGRPPAVTPVLVHVRRDGEQLYLDGRLDRGYESDPRSDVALADLARATGGTVLAEDDVAGVAAAVRAALGEGEYAAEGRRRRTLQLAPWLVVLAGLPLAFLVARRNL